MLSAAFLMPWWAGARARGENHLDYRWSEYKEGGGRILVVTHSGLAEVTPRDGVSLKAELVHDAISGASPTGTLPVDAMGVLLPPGQNLNVANGGLAELTDVRRAVKVEGSVKIGRLTLRPVVGYSVEHDYESTGIGLTSSLELNEKNTTLTLGVAHDFDGIFPASPDPNDPSFSGRRKRASKDNTDVIIGITQLLTPKTLFTANFTIGAAEGYLSDPYKAVTFVHLDGTSNSKRESRPHYRTKQIGFFSLTQFVDPLNASVEMSYRLYHDTYDIWSHTVGVQWFQKIGRHVVVAPLFRFVDQSGASFYSPSFLGDPSPVATPADAALVPTYYSADYRLAALNTLTYGVELTVIATDWLHLNFSYSRYEMRGKNSDSPADAFPKANIFTAGARVWF